ncbi:hypothetical protein DAPK24_034190 [Pichia kluyveri]|uniref:Uncharacterized protein n=1 Tax=Pichia kluyveri TaxID=36015 RepID=A0AAV5R5R6_PICKL|nr:hypothetical protein DAPK24_034190 [Pichia kluyveri]
MYSKQSQKKCLRYKTFRFNLAFFTDGANLFNKTHKSVNAQLLLVLDLPDHVMKHKEFSFTPFFYQSRAKLPGYNGEACKLLFKDLEDLHNNGMKITIEDVEYTIYADLVAIVSDGLAMPYFFESNGVGANYPCVFCKQTKTDGLNAPGVIEYIENPPSYKIFEEKKYTRDGFNASLICKFIQKNNDGYDSY